MLRAMRQLVFFFLLAGLFSCAPPVRLPLVVPEASPDELLGILAGNAASFKSLKGIARISFQEQDYKTMKGEQILLVEKPRRVRSEILGLFGQPAAVAVVNGEKASLLVPREGILYEGEASARNLQKILRIPLKIEDLVSFILYQVPVIEFQTSTVEIPAEGGYRLLLEGKGGLLEELFFSPEKKLLAARFQKGREEMLKLTYGDFTDGEKPFPRNLVLHLPRPGIEARVEFTALETNVELDEKLFRLEPPEGFQIRQLL